MPGPTATEPPPDPATLSRPAPRRRLRPAKRVAFSAVIAIGLYAFLELAASGALWIVTGSPLAGSALRAERRVLALSVDDQSLGGEVLGAAELAATAGPRVTRSGVDLVIAPHPAAADPPAPDDLLEVECEGGHHRFQAWIRLSASALGPARLELFQHYPRGPPRALLRLDLEPGEEVPVSQDFFVAAQGCRLSYRVEGPPAAAGAGGELVLVSPRLVHFAEREGQEQSARAPAFRGQEILHPYLGYVAQPGFCNRYHDSREVHAANRYGFFDDRGTLHRRAPDRVLVGIFGGSVAEMFGDLGADRLVREIQAIPRFAGREVILVPLALRGYKQPQQLLALNYLLALGGELDLVLNLDGFNEVALHLADNAVHEVDPIYPRSWALRVDDLQDPERRRKVGELSLLQEQRRLWSAVLLESPLSLSPTANLLWYLWDRELRRRIERRVRHLSRASPQESPEFVNPASPGPRRSFRNRSELLEELAETWKRCSLAMQRSAVGHGVEYFHFLQPNQYVAGSKPLSAVEREVAFEEDHPYREGAVLGYPLLRQKGAELAALGIRFQDLSSVFAETEEDIYYDACCHLNRRGNEILAREIGAALRRALGS